MPDVWHLTITFTPDGVRASDGSDLRDVTADPDQVREALAGRSAVPTSTILEPVFRGAIHSLGKHRPPQAVVIQAGELTDTVDRRGVDYAFTRIGVDPRQVAVLDTTTGWDGLKQPPPPASHQQAPLPDVPGSDEGKRSGIAVAVGVIVATLTVVGLGIGVTLMLAHDSSSTSATETVQDPSTVNEERVDLEPWMTDMVAPGLRDHLYETCRKSEKVDTFLDEFREEDFEQHACTISGGVANPATGEDYSLFEALIVTDPDVVERARSSSSFFEELDPELPGLEPGHEIRVFHSGGNALYFYDFQDDGYVRYSLYQTDEDEIQPFLRTIGLMN